MAGLKEKSLKPCWPGTVGSFDAEWFFIESSVEH